ncbi:rRNA maturation RNase YbeY [Candidatus Marinamargulisbacteria bacterium SCGC AAA071-K20]|nr:rRNA maturation RNase YbeY [Candidatus Marinamargulisbacteria bacterium SCGC AAA071-K20]
MNKIQITISNETTYTFNFDVDSFFKRILCLKDINEGIYDINFVSTKTMKTVNKTHLDRDYLTDVITFNLGSIQSPIGDIYISPEKADENSKEFKNSLNDEIKLLLVHGILHLLDYKDYSEEEKKEMDKEQERLLGLV